MLGSRLLNRASYEPQPSQQSSHALQSIRASHLYLVYPDGRERCAGRLDRYPEDVRAWIESIRRSRAGARVEGRQGSSVQVQTQPQNKPRVRVEGGDIIEEHEVELETMGVLGV